jgi:hypothetical protein
MKTYLFLGLVLLDLTIATVRPQAPAPIVIQAANAPPAAPASRAQAAPAASSSDPRAVVQLLQEMETTNAETLKKQEAALAALDELQKAAEEIKIFSKRG